MTQVQQAHTDALAALQRLSTTLGDTGMYFQASRADRAIDAVESIDLPD